MDLGSLTVYLKKKLDLSVLVHLYTITDTRCRDRCERWIIFRLRSANVLQLRKNTKKLEKSLAAHCFN